MKVKIFKALLCGYGAVTAVSYGLGILCLYGGVVSWKLNIIDMAKLDDLLQIGIILEFWIPSLFFLLVIAILIWNRCRAWYIDRKKRLKTKGGIKV